MHGHLNILTPAVLAEMARMVGYSNIIFGSKGKSTSAEVPPGIPARAPTGRPTATSLRTW